MRRAAVLERAGVEVSRAASGREVWLPFGAGHLLGAGTTGAGKSVAQRFVLGGLCRRRDVALLLADLKGGVELGVLRGRAHAVVTDQRSAVELLRMAAAELRERTRRLSAAGLDNWSTALGPWLVIGVDELAELVEAASPNKADKELAAEAAALLTSIARLGRALGVVLVCWTQRPAAESIGGALRGQFDWRLGLRVRDGGESRMVCPAEVADLTLLPGQGAAFWLPPVPGRVERCRAPFTTLDELRAVAADTAGLRPELPRFEMLAGV